MAGKTLEELMAAGAEPVSAQPAAPAKTGGKTFEELTSQGAQPAETPPEAAKPSLGKSLQGAAANGPTFGNYPELRGLSNALTFKAHGDPRPLVDIYREQRDQGRATKEAQSKAYPLAYKAVELAAGVPAAAMAGTSGLASMAVGALGASGASKADLTKGEVGQYLGDLGTGALMGKVVHSAAPYVSKGISYLSSGARSLAGRAAAAAAGVKGEGAKEVGRELIDSGVNRFGAGSETLLNRVRPVREEAGQAIGKSLNELNQMSSNGSGLTTEGLASDAARRIAKKFSHPSQQATRDSLLEELQRLAEHGPKGEALSFPEVNALKSGYDPKVNWQSLKPPEFQKGIKLIRGTIGNKLENQALGVDAETGQRLLGENARFGRLADAQDALEAKFNSESPAPGAYPLAQAARGHFTHLIADALGPRALSSGASVLERGAQLGTPAAQLGAGALLNPGAEGREAPDMREALLRALQEYGKH